MSIAKAQTHMQRLTRLASGGDLAAARELFAVARRSEHPDSLDAATRVLLAHGCWQLVAAGASAMLDSGLLPTVYHQHDPSTGTAALAWGTTNHWDHGERTQADELAARAAEISVQEVLGLRGDPMNAVWPGPEGTPEQVAEHLARRVVAAERQVAEYAAAWERAGGQKQRRAWLPRRRPRRTRRRHIRAWAGVAAISCVRDQLVAARFGTGEVFVVRGTKLLSITAPGDSGRPTSPPHINLITAVEPRRPEASDVLTVSHRLQPNDRILVVGPGFSVVRDLLSPARLISDGTPQEAAKRLIQTWGRVASNRARTQSGRQPCCMIVELRPDHTRPSSLAARSG